MLEKLGKLGIAAAGISSLFAPPALRELIAQARQADVAEENRGAYIRHLEGCGISPDLIGVEVPPYWPDEVRKYRATIEAMRNK